MYIRDRFGKNSGDPQKPNCQRFIDIDQHLKMLYDPSPAHNLQFRDLKSPRCPDRVPVADTNHLHSESES